MTEFDCGKYVAARIHGILGDASPVRLNPTARAQLAKLRQAASRTPGAAPEVWAITSEGIPEMSEKVRDRVDWAIHIALTQFALHQQSRDTRMHDQRQSFGRAVRHLAQATMSPNSELQDTSTYRRFITMSVTNNIASLAVHSRGIITQLRSHDIPFDYARYARDLYWFQIPGRAIEVQRRWGRDFHYATQQSIDPMEGSN